MYVNQIFNFHDQYDGLYVIIGMLLYTLQLYAEFSGCMDIVRGSAQMFGIEMSENFARPFISKTVSEFWRRWHMTLGAWFKDYVFYTISLSKAFMKLSKKTREKFNAFFATLIPTSIAMLAVWFGTGIWHGASWKYVMYGIYYCLIMILGLLTEPLFRKLFEKMHVNREGKIYKALQVVRTFIFVNIGMLMFRADDLKIFGQMFISMFRNLSWDPIRYGELFDVRIGMSDFLLLLFGAINYIYPIIFIGFMLCFLGKKEKIKNVGMVIFSFGLLFEGIEIMGSVMKPLANSEVFINLMGKVSDIPILGVGLGMIMTLVVQSSSATIAVLQNFASQAGPDGVHSVIGLAGAIPILLGDNIGTTITALLASIGQSKNAKRTAIAHSIFNISGSVVFLFLIPWFSRFVQYISPKGNEIDIISRQIANAHTTFNVVCTLVWLPLIPIMVKIVTFLIRGEDKKMKPIYEPKYLDENVIEQPVAAMYMVSKELNRLASFTTEMLLTLKSTFMSNRSEEVHQKFVEKLQSVDYLQDRISEYITKMFSSGNLTENQSEKIAGLLFVSTNIQRISDRCRDIDGIYGKVTESGSSFSEEAARELDNCISIIENLLSKAIDAIRKGDQAEAEQVLKSKNKIRKAEKKFSKAHLSRVKNKVCNPAMTVYYSGILDNIDRIAENCASIAEEALDNTAFVEIREDAKKAELEAAENAVLA